jgi:hypothetical protein
MAKRHKLQIIYVVNVLIGYTIYQQRHFQLFFKESILYCSSWLCIFANLAISN